MGDCIEAKDGMDPLHTFEGEVRLGEIVERPNRFVVWVQFGDSTERVFLGDPGELEGIVEPGHEIICSPVDDPERKTAYDAIAVRMNDIYVSVRTALANRLFEAAILREYIAAFEGYSIQEREPALPEHGRTDFRLETPSGDTAYVEVKSCTHVEDGVAKFPDRQTERGRRHLRSLTTLCENGIESHVVFVVQRPDVTCFQPFHEVDPEFAEVLSSAAKTGVGVHAITTTFEPPDYWLEDRDLAIDLGT